MEQRFDELRRQIEGLTRELREVREAPRERWRRGPERLPKRRRTSCDRRRPATPPRPRRPPRCCPREDHPAHRTHPRGPGRRLPAARDHRPRGRAGGGRRRGRPAVRSVVVGASRSQRRRGFAPERRVSRFRDLDDRLSADLGDDGALRTPRRDRRRRCTALLPPPRSRGGPAARAVGDRLDRHPLHRGDGRRPPRRHPRIHAAHDRASPGGRPRGDAGLPRPVARPALAGRLRAGSGAC